MLFPYHLSDVVVKGLRITPFQYYIMVLESIMGQERSYDSLPNFTAVDCLRLLGIGRNQYIELMNKTRTKSKFGGLASSLFRRSYRELLPARDVSSLYMQGLIYLDIIIDDRDTVVVPPLEGFVMNRVTGDYFETLLYKVFVSLDEQTTVGDMATLLEIEPYLVKDAVSLYCRLGFARKKNSELDSDLQHPSWCAVGEPAAHQLGCGEPVLPAWLCS